PHGGMLNGTPSRSPSDANDTPATPPVVAVSVPFLSRVPVVFARSFDEAGPPLRLPHCLQLFAIRPLSPSEMTPTRMPVPSTLNCARPTSAAWIASPSLVFDPIRCT